jgi:Na+-driven multidrug efflux pump
MNSWPYSSFLILDTFAVLLMVVSYSLYRGRNWARVVLMAGCIGYSILALVGAVLLALDDANVADTVFIIGILIWCVAGPLLVLFLLKQPEVRNDCAVTYGQQNGCTEPGESASVPDRTSVAPGR